MILVCDVTALFDVEYVALYIEYTCTAILPLLGPAPDVTVYVRLLAPTVGFTK